MLLGGIVVPSLYNRALLKFALPLLPPARRLPFKLKLSDIEDELLYLDKIVREREVALDIGTNIGLFSCKMSQIFKKVYSFEINEDITGDLKAFNPGNIEIINKGLSSKAGEATLYIPVLHGRQLDGWASLAPGNCPDTNIHVEKPVTICTLDSLNLSPVSFVKMDVEGHELEVLKGGRETFAKHRPVTIIETKGENSAAVRQFFTEVGYEERTLREVTGIEGAEYNLLFFPKSK